MDNFDDFREDDALLARLKADDTDAFTAIYRKYWSSLYNSAYRRLRDTDACKDVVQNVFTDLWSRRDKVVIANLAAYLHTAVRFQVYKQAIKQPADSDIFKILEDVLVSPIRSDDVVISAEMNELVQLWIAALPEKRRKIFIMHYYDELSTAEIAERLDISQKTVQNQLNTASTHIRARFAHFLSLSILIYPFLKN